MPASFSFRLRFRYFYGFVKITKKMLHIQIDRKQLFYEKIIFISDSYAAIVGGGTKQTVDPKAEQGSPQSTERA
ncbi:MAG: hypothetical protein II661_02290 [Bacteroidales bacterium]|nr:hypothetical protein [Bacteroidales bacterium]